MSGQQPKDAVLRVVSGAPTAEELAVVTALFAAAAGAGQRPPANGARRGGWSDPARRHRRPLVPGPNAWRASSW